MIAGAKRSKREWDATQVYVCT